MQNLPPGETFEVDAVDPEGIAMKLTVTTHLAVDRNGAYMATRTITTANGDYLSPDPVDGWHVSAGGKKYRALAELPCARPVD